MKMVTYTIFSDFTHFVAKWVGGGLCPVLPAFILNMICHCFAFDKDQMQNNGKFTITECGTRNICASQNFTLHCPRTLKLYVTSYETAVKL